jgi:prepilin-type N-terminal cleavage/methylation domain-containing protein
MQTGETTIRVSHSLVQWHGHPARESQGRPGPAHHGRDGRATHGRDAHATGFTLTEIMIAMGVLAVGMGMVAGALHAGIQVHLRTIDDIMRQLIGDNSLAMVQARVRHSTTNGITDTYKLLDSKGTPTSYFGTGDLKYPWNTVNIPNGQPGYGAAVLMKLRKIAPTPPASTTTSANDYDVLIVPYTVTPSTTGASPSEVTPSELTCTIKVGTTASPTTGSTITAAANALKAGSVVIDTRNNVVQVYFVSSAPTATTAELLETLAAGTNVKLITLTPATVTDRVECSKPVQTKTALSPAPSYTPGT